MNAETPITETEIASLVERFYAKVRVDPEIAGARSSSPITA
jgi:truncated hemoglobin YjbI